MNYSVRIHIKSIFNSLYFSEDYFLGRMRIGIKLGIQFYSLSNNENLHVSLSSDYFFVSDLKL